MRLERRAWPALLAALVLAALACGENDGGNATPRQVTANDLAAMVLTGEELGDKFAGLEPSPEESGPISNQDLIERARNPADAQADIEEFGRVGGYLSLFQGDAVIGIELSLYETAEGASRALADFVQEAGEAQVGQVGLGEFDAGDIGEETHGIVGRGQEGANSAAVAMRIDRLVALVELVVSPTSPTAEESEMQDDVRQLAQKQAEKIETVIQG